MHGSVGSSCAVADVQGDKATIWSPTQGVYTLRNSAAKLLGVPNENIRVIFTRRLRLLRHQQRRHGVMRRRCCCRRRWASRCACSSCAKDEMAWENYGIPFVADQRAGLDANSNLIAWDYEAWSATLGGRPGYDTPGNLITGFPGGILAAGVRRGARRLRPPTEPSATRQHGAALCGRLRRDRMRRHRQHQEQARAVAPASSRRSGRARCAPAERLQNTFFHESFIDEVAAASRRRSRSPIGSRYLSHPRLIDAVNAAAKAASWEARPSPKPGARRAGTASGRGMACVD